MRRNWIIKLLLILFSCVFLVSGFLLTRYYIIARFQKQQADELVQIVQQAKKEPPVRYTVPVEALDPTDPVIEVVEESDLILIQDPITGNPRPILPEYAEIYLANTDTVGWIRIEDTDINYPVMQTPDDPNYYLNHNFQKEYHSYGCIYVREVCSVDAPSDNLTIYGHRMRSGVMFYDLQNYKKEDFFREHPVIEFDTLTERHDYQILSVFLTTASVGQGFTYHEFVDASDEAEFQQYVDTCKELSLYDTGVDAQYGDKLITLSTCEYSQTNGRLVVVAKRIPTDR